MQPVDPFEAAADPNYISGIYNYCDYWCERCPFTSRCLNFATRDEGEDKPETNDVRNQAFWDKLSAVFQETLNAVRRVAEEQGIDIDGIIEDPQIEQQREARRKQAEEHDLARWSRLYVDKVEAWFSRQDRFDEKLEELLCEQRLELPGRDPSEAVAGLQDCVEVIRWYQFQIHVKLMRALDREDIELELDDDDAFPSDADGSAKVALIDMDRSIAAWGRLREQFDDTADEMLDMLILLDRMRRRTEAEFPAARAFVRPGFDTGGCAPPPSGP